MEDYSKIFDELNSKFNLLQALLAFQGFMDNKWDPLYAEILGLSEKMVEYGIGYEALLKNQNLRESTIHVWREVVDKMVSALHEFSLVEKMYEGLQAEDEVVQRISVTKARLEETYDKCFNVYNNIVNMGKE